MGGGTHGHSHGRDSAGHGHSHYHGHAHDASKGAKFCGCFYFSYKMRIMCMLSMTFFFFLVELITGQITKSISLTTDAFHMLSDSIALIIGLVSIVIAKRKSRKNTFGWIRAEVLGPLINSVFLISMCLGLIMEAVERLFEEKEIHDPSLLLIVGCIGLGINLIGMTVFGHAHSNSQSIPAIVDAAVEEEAKEEDDDDDDGPEGNNGANACTDNDIQYVVVESAVTSDKRAAKKSRTIYKEGTLANGDAADNGTSASLVLAKRNNSTAPIGKKLSVSVKKKNTKCQILSKEANMNMRAVFLHVMADALGSVIVVISALLNIFQSQLNIPRKVIVYVDPVLCLALVVLILSSTVPLLKESALILLQTVPKEYEIKQLKHDIVQKIPGILSVHELHVWKLSGTKIIATAHVTCHNSVEYMQIATDLKSFFHDRGIHSTTIQPEFTDPIDGSSHDKCILECKNECDANTCCGKTVTSAPQNIGDTNLNAKEVRVIIE